jgi:uncharacterized protein YybS (DUF2232 family)
LKPGKIEVKSLNNDRMNRRVLEGIILAIASSIYGIFSIYYSLPLLLILPVGFIILGIKHDLISSILSLITSLLIVGLVLETYMISLGCLLIFGPFIITNIYLISQRTKPTRVVIYSTAVFFVSLLVLIILLNLVGFELIPYIEAIFNQILSSQLEVFEEMGLTTYEILQTRDLIKAGYNALIMITPGTMFITSLIIGYISYVLTTWGLRKMEINIINLPRFSRLRLPDNFAIGALGMILTAFIISKLKVNYGDIIYLNVKLVVSFVIFVQGLSVVNYFLIKIKMKKFIRVFTYILILLTPLFSEIVSIVGVADILFDLRKIRKARS